MSLGGKVSATVFNGNNKVAWLLADIHGLLYTCAAVIAIGFLFELIVYSSTGHAVITHSIHIIKERFGANWAFAIASVMALVPPFLLVFVFRWNFTVLGPRRQFRYICSWL